MNTQPTRAQRRRALRRARIIHGLAERLGEDLPKSWDSLMYARAVQRAANQLISVLRFQLQEDRR